ncbi:MAG: HAMP domain-containing histidine kinase [Oscillospiraceae bacterium]|nr:HAMP domain-containing histidine kinase [Oscillospiraceae bacterium]
MERKIDCFGMLDLMMRPGFCVKNTEIVHVNPAAQAFLLTVGTDIQTLLLTGQEEYRAFTDGCLYVKLALSAGSCGACVVCWEDQHVFLLDLEEDEAVLRVLALAARELREPLTSMMLCSDHMYSSESDPDASARMNRSIHQMLRLLGNMSDAGHSISVSRQETLDIAALLAEIFEKAQTLTEQTGLTLRYQGLPGEVLGLADGQQIERAVLNILSNAIKFTPKGGTIDAALTRHGKMLRLSITDSGSGIAEGILRNVFCRYLRQPGIEDSRFGLGLGMVLVRAAAANHGGTVLIDQPSGKGTRVTLTLAIRQSTETTLRSPVMRIDYAGERDHGLVELSDSLPLAAYQK